MILLIDNYDSFSYNLYQLIGEINSDIKVIRNDEMTVDEIKAVTYAKQLMHGKQSVCKIDNTDTLFKGLPDEIKVARYHSLAADDATMPECLKVIAKTDDGEIMAVKHKEKNIWGVQFHPESIMTPDGRAIIKNFLGGSTND